MKPLFTIVLACLFATVGGQVAAADREICLSADPAALAATPAVIECLLDSGRHSVALLLAQRLVAAQPDDTAARSLLASALAALNADPAASAYDWPGSPRKSLWRGLLDSVQHAAWIGVELGRDSNINSATSLETVPIPLLNYRSLQLDPLLVQRASPFIGVNAGAAVRKPLSASLAIGARASAAARVNSAQFEYLPHNYQGELSLIRHFGDTQLEFVADFAQDWVARFRFVDRLGGGLRLSVPWLRQWNVEFSAGATRNHYPQFNGVKTTLIKGSAGITHAASGLSGSIHGGEEKAQGSTKDLDRRFAGVSLGWRWPVLERGTLFARIGTVRSEYLLPSPLFATQRLDTARDVELAFSYRWDAHWSVTPRMILEQNSSSIPLVSFKRSQALVEIRRNF